MVADLGNAGPEDAGASAGDASAGDASVDDVRRPWAVLGAVLVAVVLSACATTPGSGPSSARRGPPGGEGGATGGASAGRRGAYYLDDGPGDRDRSELAALAELPEPVPVPEPLHPRANRPYRVMGNDYRPMAQIEPFRQRGTASWYGRRFHGLPTSTGERYDMYRMTAAHPTLPVPSFARVTNLENGRSVVVRVNDRGPFLHGRAIDLSLLAAYKLGYVERGSAEVEVELLDASRPSAVAAAGLAAAPAAARTLAAPVPGAAPGDFVAVPGPPASGVAGNAPLAADGRASGQATPGTREDNPAAVEPIVEPVATLPVLPVQTLRTVPASQPAPGVEPAGNVAAVEATRPHYLQLGAFSARTNAAAAMVQLRRQLDWLQVPIEIEPAGNLFRVRAGPYRVREFAMRDGLQVAARTGLRPLLLPGRAD